MWVKVSLWFNRLNIYVSTNDRRNDVIEKLFNDFILLKFSQFQWYLSNAWKPPLERAIDHVEYYFDEERQKHE